MAFNLASVRRGYDGPPRITIHGDPGVGKTTFAASAPSPIFLCTEDGLGSLDVPAFPLAQSYGDVVEALGALFSEPHDYETLVVDSLDWLEPLIWDEVCRQHDVPSIEAFGYGKGYVEANKVWREFFSGVTALRDARKMTVIMIAHSQKVRVNDPMVEAYDRWDIKLHKHAAGIAEEYSDIILFATQHVAVIEEGKGFDKRKRAISNGARVVHTVGKPSVLAKNRYGLSPIIEMPATDSYAPFAAELAESYARRRAARQDGAA